MGGIVQQRRAASGEARVDRSEALRYMGYGKSLPGEEVMALIESCEEELLAVLQPRCCWLETILSFPKKYVVEAGFGTVESVVLYRHLQGCGSVLLFAATIGIGVERLVARYQRLSPSKAAVIDALASSAIECWCDDMERELLGARPHCTRFSPGYGDFALEHQRDFACVLDMPKTLGVSLSDSLLMTPCKSVTAVIGIGASRRECGGKCMSCGLEHCMYREIQL